MNQESNKSTVAKKTTVGSQTLKLLERPDTKQGVIDTMYEMTKQFLPQIEECIKKAPWSDAFYVVVINKRERLMVNVIRQYFVSRQTLPTPEYDQTVFKYDPKTGDLKYLWTVPDKETVSYIILNQKNLPVDHHQMIHFCRAFVKGTLDKVYGE